MTTMEICSKAFAFVRSLLLARVISQSNQFEIQIGPKAARSLARTFASAGGFIRLVWFARFGSNRTTYLLTLLPLSLAAAAAAKLAQTSRRGRLQRPVDLSIGRSLALNLRRRWTE